MDVAVSGVTEAGDGDPVFLLELGGELEQVKDPAAGHGDILVELDQSRVP